MSGSTTVGHLRAIVSADSKQFSAEMARIRRTLSGVSGTFTRVGNTLKATGRTMATHLTLPIAGMGTSIVRTAGQFEASMNFVRALTKASGDDFERLRRAARDLGRDTQFTASEAGDAMGYLAQAGLSVDEILSAVPQTLALAAAAKLDLAEATDRALKVMSGYGMKVADLGRINDVLAKSASSTNTTIVDLTEAFFKVGPLARAAGMEFEETSAVLAQLQDGGFQGAEAGTALKAILGGILNPSKAAAAKLSDLGITLTDAKGKMLPFAEVMARLKPLANDTGGLLQLFAKRGGPGMAALLGKGEQAVTKLHESLKGAGGEAQRVATERMKGFEGSWKTLVSAFEELQIAIAESGLLATVTKVVDQIAGFLRELSKTAPELLKTGTVIAAVAASLGPAVWVVGTMLTTIGTLGSALAAAGTAIVGFLGGPVTLLIAAAVAIAAAWHAWGDDLQAAFPETFAALSELAATAEAIVTDLGQVIADISTAIGQAIATLTGTSLPSLRAAWGQFVATLSIGAPVAKAILEGFAASVRSTFAAIRAAWSVVGPVLTAAVKATIKTITDAWASSGPAVIASVRAMIDGIQQQLVTRLAGIVTAVQEKVNAVGGFFKGLWDKVTRNSYIPEMMDDIRDEFGKLEGQMVQPAQAQTRKVSELFRAMKENVANALKSLSGKLMSQAIGGFGGWGTRSGLLGGIQNLFGFADGGAFTVGGAGGIDSQLVAFRASPGERVTVDQAGEGSGGITVVQNLHFHPGVPETVRAELRRATPGIRESMLAALQDRVLRGGGFARAVRGA